MAGRPRKPTAVKALQGTLQKCRTNPDEPKPAGDLKLVEAPEFLTDTAKDIWRYALAMAPKGLLTSLDFGIFTEWVVTYDAFVHLSAAMKETGTIQKDEDGNVRVNDILHHVTKTAAILNKLQNDMGFTPASRTKISVKQAEPENNNKFANLD